MEVNGQANTKTRERTEGVATAVQAIHRDSCTAQKVQDGPKTTTSFGVNIEPPDLPCREDVVVKSRDAAPKSCLPSLEMRTTATAGGFVPTGKASTATETIFNQPPLRFYSTEETDWEANCKKTSTLYASYDSSVYQTSNLPAALFCQRVVETKSRRNRTFDPGGFQSRLRACPVRGACCFVVRLYMLEQQGDELQRFSRGDSLALLKQGQPRLRCARKSFAVEADSSLHEPEGRTEVTPSMATRGDRKLGANGCRGASRSEELDGNFAERIPVFWTSQAFKARSATLSSPYDFARQLLVKNACVGEGYRFTTARQLVLAMRSVEKRFPREMT